MSPALLPTVLLSVIMAISFKRARAEYEAAQFLELSYNSTHTDRENAGKKLREFVIDKCISSWNAKDVCTLAYFHTNNGGTGLEDMSLHPDLASKHGSDHLKCLAHAYIQYLFSYMFLHLFCVKVLLVMSLNSLFV